eukprot:8691992-Pyramimonas_sp.AAC.1
MRQDAHDGFGGPSNHQQRVDLICQQIFNGVERELLPLFQVEEPNRVVGRSSGLEYRHVTAGGALA